MKRRNYFNTLASTRIHLIEILLSLLLYDNATTHVVSAWRPVYSEQKLYLDALQSCRGDIIKYAVFRAACHRLRQRGLCTSAIKLEYDTSRAIFKKRFVEARINCDACNPRVFD